MQWVNPDGSTPETHLVYDEAKKRACHIACGVFFFAVADPHTVFVLVGSVAAYNARFVSGQPALPEIVSGFCDLPYRLLNERLLEVRLRVSAARGGASSKLVRILVTY